MGIRGLETFIKTRVKNGTCVFHMDKLIEHQRQTTGQEVLILIDVDGMMNNCCTDSLDIIVGMRSQVYLGRVRDFFQKLVDAGAKLVFFTDGPPQGDKHPTWIKRQNAKYDECLVVLDKIEKLTPVRDILRDGIPSTTMSATLLKHEAKKFGTLHVAIDNECDLELAAYAQRHNAFAILGDDSDFLIYPGEWRYWSIKQIDTEKMTTLAYNKGALRAHLALSPLQMPTFAALAGNDIVQFEDIKGFHQRIGWKDKFDNIAHYVRPLPLNITERDEILESIAKDVFSHRSDWRNFKDFLKHGIEIYDYKTLQTVQKTPFLQKLLDRNLKDSYVLLKEIPYTITALFENMRETTTKSYSQMTVEFRARTVGVMLKHRNDPNLRVNLVVKMTHEDPYRQVFVSPIYPEFDVPSHEQLMLREPNDGMDMNRIQLLSWMLTGSDIQTDPLRLTQIFKLPQAQILPLIVLAILVRERKISVTMADNILLVVHYSSMCYAPAPEYLVKEAFTACFLYLKMYNSLKKAMKIFGLKDFVALDSFDGFLFHKIHQGALDAATYEKWMEPLLELRFYALE